MLPSGRRGQVATGGNLLEAARQLGSNSNRSVPAARPAKCQVVVEVGAFAKHGTFGRGPLEPGREG